MDKQTIKGRRRARKIALQAIYQRLISKTEMVEIEAQFRAIHGEDKVDFEYFCRLFHGVEKAQESLDEALLPFLDRPIKNLNPIELAVLRLGAFELTEVLETPYRVILDESVNLSKTFGSQDGHRYVNGVLNNLAKKVRAVEIDSN
ncbi:MAG: transcription antitermination factor NusB [Gammaproteobacteria bacterium]|nr:transcription antitermination factor NusB [Gammaproteobacteria bacterium]